MKHSGKSMLSRSFRSYVSAAGIRSSVQSLTQRKKRWEQVAYLRVHHPPPHGHRVRSICRIRRRAVSAMESVVPESPIVHLQEIAGLLAYGAGHQ
jgi:hypothetical protein